MTAQKNGIVVGVDDSASSQAALAWALDEAQLRQVPLTAVRAWTESVAHPSGAVALGADVYRPQAEQLLRDAIDPWRDKYPDVTIHTLVSDKPSAAALIGASRDAELLVVGARGHGGFTGMLLGSVSRAVTHRAHCPVVVIRDNQSWPRGDSQ